MRHSLLLAALCFFSLSGGVGTSLLATAQAQPLTSWCRLAPLCETPDLLVAQAVPPSKNAAPAKTESDAGVSYELQFAKGMVHYNAGNYEAAEGAFRGALRSLPDDPDASYYLGQTLTREKKYAEAEQVFRAMLSKNPSEHRATLGLAIVQYHLSNFQETIARLAEAEKTLRDEPLVHFYQGLAQSRVGAYNEAIPRFARSMALSPDLAAESHFYSGEAYYKQGVLEEAKDEFQAVVSAEPDTELGRQAKQYLEQIAAVKPQRQKRWDLQISVSQAYDSNVVALPLGTQPPGGSTGISQKQDYVTGLYARGEYKFWQATNWASGLSYSIYQNFHSELSSFDTQDHTPSFFVDYQDTRIQARASYTFDYVTLGKSPYLHANAANGLVNIAETQTMFLQVQAHYQYKDFQSNRFAFNPTRNARNYLIGLTQYFMFAENKGNIHLGFTFDTDLTGGGSPAVANPGFPANSDWAYRGYKTSVGMGLPPILTLKADVGFDWYYQQYLNPNSFSATGTTTRRDNIYLVNATVGKALTQNLDIALQWNYTRDSTNVPVFDYTRNVTSVIVSGHF